MGENMGKGRGGKMIGTRAERWVILALLLASIAIWMVVLTACQVPLR